MGCSACCWSFLFHLTCFPIWPWTSGLHIAGSLTAGYPGLSGAVTAQPFENHVAAIPAAAPGLQSVYPAAPLRGRSLPAVVGLCCLCHTRESDMK